MSAIYAIMKMIVIIAVSPLMLLLLSAVPHYTDSNDTNYQFVAIKRQTRPQ